MNELISRFLEQVAESQRMEFRGRDIYETMRDQEGFKYVPRCIYFTYVGLDDDRKIRIDHYFYPGGKPDVENEDWDKIPYPKNASVDSVLKDTITHLANNARGSNDNPKPYAKNFKNIKWRRKSYMCVYFDDKHWKLHKYVDRTLRTRRAIVFYTVKNGHQLTPNHTFYDGIDFELQVQGDAHPRSAVVFINHLKDENGVDLYDRNKPEPYEFGMYLGVELAGGEDSPLTVIIDPGGTNQGPPLEP